MGGKCKQGKAIPLARCWIILNNDPQTRLHSPPFLYIFPGGCANSALRAVRTRTRKQKPVVSSPVEPRALPESQRGTKAQWLAIVVATTRSGYHRLTALSLASFQNQQWQADCPPAIYVSFFPFPSFRAARHHFCFGTHSPPRWYRNVYVSSHNIMDVSIIMEHMMDPLEFSGQV